jgi:hypothetical protein
MEKTIVELIKKREFAELAGVTPGNITQLKKRLGGAVVGNKIDVNHPAAKLYISQRSSRDVKIESKRMKQGIPSINNLSKLENKSHLPALGIPKDSPKEVIPDELAKLTLEEIVNNYGSLEQFSMFVVIQKNFDEFKKRNAQTRHLRGELVDRKKLGMAVFGLIKKLFDGLVNDIPKRLTEKVISIVNNDVVNANYLIEKEYRENNSKILESCKREITEYLETN